MISHEALATLLRDAEKAHKEYEKTEQGQSGDQHWSEFYANFMLQHLGRLWP